MCGIAGLLGRDTRDAGICARFEALALHHLAKRGPDDAQTWREGGVQFWHTRLSIIDGPGGVQPMVDEDGALVFNGEIYNHADLREPGTDYRTRSDTEVLLKGLAREGAAFLDRLDGMFAFAYLDRRRRRLLLGRDGFGIKPLYYVHDGERFAFASTMHPLMIFSDKEVNAAAFAQYYMLRAARGANTLFTDVHELPAGSVLELDLATFEASVRPWRRERERQVVRRSEADLLDELDQTLHLAVRRHLVSDVPVATLLSGGVDSSLITAIAAGYQPDLATFSIGFKDERFDESPHAQAVARRYGLRHYVKFCEADDFLRLLDGWSPALDDPVADPSAVMVHAVARFAREHGYKVVLTGEGSDEFFGGYNQYYRFRWARRLSLVGRALPFAADLVARLAPHRTRHIHFLEMATRRAAFGGTSMIFEPHLAREVLTGAVPDMAGATSLREALVLDQGQRLSDDLLTSRDRATMQASIEARVPFVTRYVADFARGLDESMLVRGRTRKYLLKRLAERYVPRSAIHRPKVGFDLPLADWFRGPLRDFVHDTLRTTWQRDYFQPGSIDRILDWHMSGRANLSDKIWALLLLDRNVDAMRRIS